MLSWNRGRVALGSNPLGLPQIRTCTFAHTGRHIMSSLRDGSLSESALRLAPDAATDAVKPSSNSEPVLSASGEPVLGESQVPAWRARSFTLLGAQRSRDVELNINVTP
jgi:hypothetical protein